MARPRKTDALDIRLLAVNHALDLIKQRSDYDFTMAELAGKIGCSAPALYSHFTGKDALLQAVRQHGFMQVAQRKSAHYADEMSNPLDRLHQGGIAYLDFARSNPALYRLLYAPPPAVAADASPIPEQAVQAFTKAIQTCQGTGFAPNRPAREVALMLWSMVHGAAMLTLDKQMPGESSEADWNAAKATVDTAITLLSPPSR